MAKVIKISNQINTKLNLKANIVLLGDGFESQSDFLDLCNEFKRKFLKYSPFSILNNIEDVINIYSVLWTQSDFEKFSNSEMPNSILELEINNANNSVDFNKKRLLEIIKTFSTNKNLFNEEYNKLFNAQIISKLNPNTLVAVLVPNNEYEENLIELEGFLEDDRFYFVLTSVNQFWEQIIIRAFCKLLGLANEYTFDTSEYFEPKDINSILMIDLEIPNLLYYDNLSVAQVDLKKWNHLISSDSSIKNDGIKTSDSRFQYSSEKIELWEGGGGYETKVYRSSQDCLMRRQIGNQDRPVKKTKVPLCLICETYIRNKLIEISQHNSENYFDFRHGSIK